LNQEDLATGWSELQAEPLEVLIPPDLIDTRGRGEGIDNTLRELTRRHEVRICKWLPGLHIGSQKNATGAMLRNE
jgi:hypothetical protein